MNSIKKFLFGPGDIDVSSIGARIVAGAVYILGFGIVFSMTGLALWLFIALIGSFEKFFMLFSLFIAASYILGVYLFNRWG
jgi:hypothetical protein